MEKKSKNKKPLPGKESGVEGLTPSDSEKQAFDSQKEAYERQKEAFDALLRACGGDKARMAFVMESLGSEKSED
jgi:hypothetical protein